MQLGLRRLQAKNALIELGCGCCSINTVWTFLFWEDNAAKNQHSPLTALLPAVKACTNWIDCETGKKIQTDVIASNLHSDIYVANSLIHMFAKCGSMSEASTIFSKMPLHSVVSWNALILGYVVNGEDQPAFQWFQSMRSRGCEANHRTLWLLRV